MLENEYRKPATHYLSPMKDFAVKINSRAFLFSFCMCCSCLVLLSQEIIQDKQYLHAGWSFREAGDTLSYPARVPGCIHTDLLSNNLIPDPFYGMNERDLQWIDKKDWVYQSVFLADTSLLNRQHVGICFEGLDTYADVYLNEQHILSANNMFRTWEIEIRHLLQPGANKLIVHFRSPVQQGLAAYNQLNYLIPVSENDQSELGGLGQQRISPYIRKAPYHFGWDWGPRFVTSGIWRPVYLTAWDDACLTDTWIQQDSLTDRTAYATAFLEINATHSQVLSVRISNETSILVDTTISLQDGENRVPIRFNLDNYHLWWPRGMGNPALYSFDIELYKQNRILQRKTVKTGFRKIALVQEDDSLGTSFYFKINDIAVFAKGANYIPQDMFPDRVSKDKYARLLRDAAEANMNMIRVWGGGYYEDDYFYDLCDSLGLMVWQDFMFSCSMYPGDSSFLDNVRLEAIDNIKRLRHHPCIVLWCGNNENLIAWESWGWKKQTIKDFGQPVADTIWQAYDTLFHKLLPACVQTYHPGIAYWPSSPGAAWGKKQSMERGDQHYWMVWWGGWPFGSYEKEIGRFMSEYGFQSFPLLASVQKFTDPADHDIYSDVMKSHQRSSIGNATIIRYMEQYYKVPASFSDLLYVSQLLQAKGMQTAIEAHRRARPYCMGSLYWQLNDCWPAASWSGIDYYGKWKALHYQAKRSFSPLLLSPILENDKLVVHIIADEVSIQPATLHWKGMDMQGKIWWQGSQRLDLRPQENQQIHTPLPVIDSMRAHQDYIYIYLTDNEDHIIGDNLLFFKEPKDLTLERASIQYSTMPVEGGYNIILTSDRLALGVYLRHEQEETGHFSDNFFNLLPGMSKTIHYKGLTEPSLQIQSLRDTY